MLQFSTQNKIRINPCCNFPHKTNFESTYVAIVLTQQNSGQPIFHKKQTSDQPTLQFSTKQNSDQPMLDFTTQNKLRINLCCNCPDTTKFGSTYFSQKTNFRSTYVAILHKTKFGSTYVGLYHTKQIRINLCWTLPHKTKFGSTYVGLYHTKQNSDQPMLDFSTQNKFGSTYVAIFHTKQNSRNVPSYVRTCFSRDS